MTINYKQSTRFLGEGMKSIVKSILLISILVVISYAGPSGPPSEQGEKIVTARLLAPTKELNKQKSSSILLEINIKKGWHINSDQPLADFLIPTKIRFEKTNGVTFGRIQYMKPELRKF